MQWFSKMSYVVYFLNQCLDICPVFCCMLCLVKFLDSLLTTPSTSFICLLFLWLESLVQNWKFLKVGWVVRKEPKKWGSTCQSNVPILDAKGVIKLSKKSSEQAHDDLILFDSILKCCWSWSNHSKSNRPPAVLRFHLRVVSSWSLLWKILSVKYHLDL